MFNQESTKLSFYERTTLTTPKSGLTIYQVYRVILGEGLNNNLRKLTEELRSLSDPDPDREKDLKRDFKKNNFSAISFGGEFSHRSNQDLLRPSNLVCLDFDHIGTTEQVEEMKQKIAQETELDPVLLFVSPSGDGLKVVVNVRQEIRDDKDFKQAFKSLRRFCQERLNLKPDESRKDISGLCYLPYDGEAVLNQAGAGFDVEKWKPVEAPKPTPPVRQTSVRSSSFDEPDDYTRALIAVEDIETSGIDITSDRKDWRDIGFALSTLGEEGRSLFHRVSQFYPNYDPQETDEQFDSFLRGTGQGITLNSLFKIAKNHGVRLRSSNVYSQRTQKRGESGGPQDGTGSPSTQSVEAPQRKGNQAPDEDEMTRLRSLLAPTTESAIIERGKNRPPSLSTGYRIEGNGRNPQKLLLPSGKLTEIAGATGHGKTLFLMNLLLNVAKMNPDRRFVLFTYEEDSDTIIGYLLNIYLSDLNLMRAGDWRSNRILIDEYLRGQGTENFNPTQVAEFVRRKDLFFRQYIETGRILIKYTESNSSELVRSIRFLSRPENNVGGVFIDYFQYINPDPDKRFPTRQEALKSICIELKDIATETQLPVVLACQFNQEVLAPTDVLLNKIGEAGDISRIGSECWGLWQMGKDIGRKLDNKDETKVEDLNRESQNIGLNPKTFENDPFLKGMYLRILKSRIVETGSEEMFKFRGLTGKIYPNDTEGDLSVEDWDRPDPSLNLSDDDDLPDF